MLIDASKRIPGGVLVFFASYGALDAAVDVWRDRGLMLQLESVKPVFADGKKIVFDALIAKYRAAASKPRGAILLSVFRGKASEGIDFADDQARAVFCIGIPYPSTQDPKVLAKKEYQEYAEKSLSADDWYNLQAYRACNQSFGRVIRHKNDYGAIFLVDQRFEYASTKANLSHWVQEAVRDGLSLDKLEAFFKNR